MTSIEKRFKLLALLCIELDVLDDKITTLGNAIDEGHPEAEKALSFYEDGIIRIFEERAFG
jgi:hypothetical protein